MRSSRKHQLPAKVQPAPKWTRRMLPTLTSDGPRPLTTVDIPTIVNTILDTRHNQPPGHQPPVTRDDPSALGPDLSAAAAATLGN